jgi:chromosome segregation ATPase
MATATKQRASAELEALQKTRDKLHAKVREAFSRRRDWDEETERMKARLSGLVNTHPEQVEGIEKRVRPGTEAAKLRDQIKDQMRSENPHQGAYEEAFAPYQEADLALQRFKVTRLDDRLAELEPDANRAIDRLRGAFGLLVEACEEYGEAVLRVRDLVIDTPGLDGQHYGFDPRPEEWRRQAQEAMESEILKPGLAPTGAAKAASHV